MESVIPLLARVGRRPELVARRLVYAFNLLIAHYGRSVDLPFLSSAVILYYSPPFRRAAVQLYVATFASWIWILPSLSECIHQNVKTLVVINGSRRAAGDVSSAELT